MVLIADPDDLMLERYIYHYYAQAYNGYIQHVSPVAAANNRSRAEDLQKLIAFSEQCNPKQKAWIRKRKDRPYNLILKQFIRKSTYDGWK